MKVDFFLYESENPNDFRSSKKSIDWDLPVLPVKNNNVVFKTTNDHAEYKVTDVAYVVEENNKVSVQISAVAI